EVGDVDAREDGVGGGGLEILRQADAGDVEAHAERGQLDDGSRVAEPELPNQVCGERLGVAESVGVSDGLLITAAIGAFAGEGDVRKRADAGRSLITVAEEQPVSAAEV